MGHDSVGLGAIGLDLQESFLSLAIREGAGERRSVASIGDGRGPLVPAVAEKGQWGGCIPGPLLRARMTALTRSESDTDALWGHLFTRCHEYLGFMSPTLSSGYEFVVSVPSDSPEGYRSRLARVARRAGFDDPSFVRPVEAVLARWLNTAVLGGQEVRRVVTVHIGEATTEVGAFRLRRRRAGSWTLDASAPPSCIEDSGWLQWFWTVADDILGRPEVPSEYDLMGVAAGVFELGRAMAVEAGSHRVAWNGRYVDHLQSAVPTWSFERGLSEWPGATTLVEHLPSVVAGAADHVAEGDEPMVVVLGGPGATWPFARRALSEDASTWTSSSPILDAAIGASCWPEWAARLGIPDTPGPRPSTPSIPAGSPLTLDEEPPPFL